MVPRTLQRIMTVTAFAAAFVVSFMASLLAPRVALASNAVGVVNAVSLASCEAPKAQTDLLPDRSFGDRSFAEKEEACSLGETTNSDLADAGNSRVAAMCSEYGASMVAPGRVLPVVDARLDAAPGCGSDVSAPVAGPGPDDVPIGPPAFALADHGVLAGGLAVPPASFTLAPPFTPLPGGPRAGVKHGIEHPPR